MNEDNFDSSISESLVIGTYDSMNPFGPVKQLVRCGECDGLYQKNFSRYIMGMYMAPIGDEAIERQKQADEHNRNLDRMFFGSKLCFCKGRNKLFKNLEQD